MSISPKSDVLGQYVLNAAQTLCASVINLEDQKHMSESEHNTYSGMAALSICESLLLALNDAKVLPESDIMGVLKDAAAAHENAGGSDINVESDKAVAALINRIITGGNSVRRA